MSTAAEQARALIAAEEFLRDLTVPTGRSYARRDARRARTILRHYPGPAELRLLLWPIGSEAPGFLAMLDDECARRLRDCRPHRLALKKRGAS